MKQAEVGSSQPLFFVLLRTFFEFFRYYKKTGEKNKKSGDTFIVKF